VHLVLRGLGAWPDHQLVDVHVCRTRHHEGDRVGDVVGGERLGHACIDRVGLLLVTSEALGGELRGPHHARRYLAHPDRLVVELEAQRLGHHLGAVLGRRVAATALVGDPAGRRADVQDHPGPAGDQRGDERLGHPHQPDHVHLEHRAPLVHVRLRDRRRAERGSGVVDEHVEPWTDLACQGVHLVGVRDVAADRRTPDLRGEGPHAVLAAGSAEHVEARGGEPACGGLADAAAGSGHDGAGAAHPPIVSQRPRHRRAGDHGTGPAPGRGPGG
jgi:hypothetical protein